MIDNTDYDWKIVKVGLVVDSRKSKAAAVVVVEVVPEDSGTPSRTSFLSFQAPCQNP